jgi:NADP-dependent 3-hydroxy acid dehydrogenase YdfG
LQQLDCCKTNLKALQETHTIYDKIMTEPSVVLVTGGNTGIGFESVKALYASPQAHTILMGSRSLDKAKDAISKLQTEVADSKSEVIPLQIDIENDVSIEAAVKEVGSKYGHLDTLLNNAGKLSFGTRPKSYM